MAQLFFDLLASIVTTTEIDSFTLCELQAFVRLCMLGFKSTNHNVVVKACSLCLDDLFNQIRSNYTVLNSVKIVLHDLLNIHTDLYVFYFYCFFIVYRQSIQACQVLYDKLDY